MKNLVAVVLGPSSERLVMGQFYGTKLKTKTLHRFLNGVVKIHGNMHWYILDIFVK